LKPVFKLGLVAAGYVAAFLVASAVVAVRIANTSGPDAQASSGMYAFGDAYLFVATFGVLALVPTGAALYWLRPYRQFWVALSALGLGIAITGAAAGILFALGRHAEASSTLGAWASASVLRILFSPVLTPAFLVAALVTPYVGPRRVLFAATVVELAVVVYAGLVWFLPLFFDRATS